MPAQSFNELRVDPTRVIAILKARFTEETAKSAVLEAAWQEALQREARLTAMLEQAQARQEDDPAPAGLPGVPGTGLGRPRRLPLAR